MEEADESMKEALEVENTEEMIDDKEEELNLAIENKKNGILKKDYREDDGVMKTSG